VSNEQDGNYRITAEPLIFARFFWICDRVILSQQKGVYRVNCIDCLDRTNVVQVSTSPFYESLCDPQMMQSAFARHVLNRQLLALALLNPSEAGRREMDVFFNDGMTSG
jgi:hypothetical protein